MKGARGVLINITGGHDMTLFEVDEAANRIRAEVDPDANIIFGSTFDDMMEGRIRVSVVATGMEIAQALKQQPPKVSVVSRLSDARQQVATRGRDDAAGRPAADGHAAEVAFADIEMPRDTLRVDAGEKHLAATGTDGSAMSNVFIAPAPVSKADVEGAGASDLGHANGDGQRSRTRMSNLLARIAGTGGPKPAGGPAQPEAAEDPAFRKAPRLGGLSTTERLPSSQTEEDLLDIPAFLRRQAN